MPPTRTDPDTRRRTPAASMRVVRRHRVAGTVAHLSRQRDRLDRGEQHGPDRRPRPAGWRRGLAPRPACASVESGPRPDGRVRASRDRHDRRSTPTPPCRAPPGGGVPCARTREHQATRHPVAAREIDLQAGASERLDQPDDLVMRQRRHRRSRTTSTTPFRPPRLPTRRASETDPPAAGPSDRPRRFRPVAHSRPVRLAIVRNLRPQRAGHRRNREHERKACGEGAGKGSCSHRDSERAGHAAGSNQRGGSTSPAD